MLLSLSGFGLESNTSTSPFSVSLELGSWDAKHPGTKTKKDTKKPPVRAVI